MPDSDLDLFLVCLPGLEPWLARELRGLGLGSGSRDDNNDDDDGIEEQAGGVAMAGDLSSVYRANLESGLASHVLIRVSEFGARSLKDLDIRGARIDWTQWLRPGTRVEVRASCRRSRIYHSGAAEERIAKHLAAHLGEPTDGGEPTDDSEPTVVRVRIHDNRCTISLDSSGAPLHRRGWRLDPGRAPLREDLAHALVLASGWDGTSQLRDPMMGSGTILIEAAAWARRLAPGRLRSFACETFAIHDPSMLEDVKRAVARATLPGLEVRLIGTDRDASAVATARANAERAGVLADLDLREASVSESLTEGPAGTGALVTNPPYGKRLDDQESLGDLYRALGNLARRLPGCRVAFAASDRKLALRTGLDLQTAFLVDSGGLKIRAMRGVVPTDSTPTDSPSTGATA